MPGQTIYSGVRVIDHELNKLDKFLNLSIGTSYNVLIKHQDSRVLDAQMRMFGITLDGDGLVPKSQHGKFKALMQRAGVHKRYWKDPDAIAEEQEIAELPL